MFLSLSLQITANVVFCFAIGVVLSGLVVAVARFFSWQSLENERSLHQGTILVGGGCTIVIIVALSWFFQSSTFNDLELAVFSSFLALALISWIDDIRGVPIGLRFFTQFAVVTICLTFLPDHERVFSSIWPLSIDRVLTGLCWIWFINLFNFMDGIDGLAASESITICFGVLCVGLLTGIPFVWLVVVAALLGSSLGFLPWNWSPSKIILGDVGAISMGFLIGLLLIQLAVKQQLFAAFILPLYFILDATITILKRLLQGKKIWHAHREHFYQKAVLAGTKPSHVVLVVIATNIILWGLAYLSVSKPIVAGVMALFTVSLLLFYLYNKARA